MNRIELCDRACFEEQQVMDTETGCIWRNCVHQPVEIYCSLLVKECSVHLPSDCRRRRAEDLAVHHHSLPLHGGVFLPVAC